MRINYAWAAIVAAILTVSQAAFAGELFPKVLVMPAPLKPYTDEILRGLGSADSLLRPGQEPHAFALSPSQARALDNADILIVPDLGMNPVLANLAAKKKKLRVIELSKLAGAEPLPYAPQNPFLAALQPNKKDVEKEEHTHEHEHENEKEPLIDPHFWLDPERMAAIAAPLADAITKTAPEARPMLRANAETLSRHLRRELLPNLKAMLNNPVRTTNAMQQPELPFITYHASYQYFLERFGLTHTGEITQRPEELIGGKSMVDVMTSASGTRVRCLITEQETPLAARIAKSTGAKITLISPEQLVERSQVDTREWLQNDYDRLLYQISKSIAQCL